MNEIFPEGAERRFDLHTVRREGEIMHVCFCGNLTLGNVKALAELQQAIVDEFGYLLLLMNVHEATGIDMAARKYSTEWGTKYAGAVFSAAYGAHPMVRGMLNLMSRATEVFSRRSSKLSFFDTDAEARAWLLKQIPRE